MDEEQYDLPKPSGDPHKLRHMELYEALDELVADFINSTGKTPSKMSVLEFMQWAYHEASVP